MKDTLTQMKNNLQKKKNILEGINGRVDENEKIKGEK